MSLDTESKAKLFQAWQELKTKEPRIYTRDAATKLGVSEAQLIALKCPESAYRLQIADYPVFFNGAMQFGTVMFIVRNESAVLEMDGQLTFEAKEHFVSGTSKDLLLAVAPQSIGSVFSVHAEEWMKRGILFFDKKGDSVLKIYFRDNEKCGEVDAWLKSWICPDQNDPLPISVCEESSAEKKCDHHQATADTSAKIPAESYKSLLESIAQASEPVTLSVCNTGCHFSVTSIIKKVAAMGPWFNILDKELHLHLREDMVASATASKDAPSKSARFAFQDTTGKTILRLRVSSEDTSAKALLG